MSKKGLPLTILNIDAQLGKARNRVHRIGIELEGGWSKLPQGARIVRDGSIQLSELDVLGRLVHHVGELTSPPIEVRGKNGWSMEFLNFMQLNYPQVVNGTCGMHVHLSFTSCFAYQRLMVPSYPGTVVEYMRRWAVANKLPSSHPIWERLAGSCRFCQHVFFADDQSRNRGKDYNQEREGHRYTVINYCWSRYQTLECRLLPMMSTSSLGISAIQELVNITNAFLSATAKRTGGGLAREEKLNATHVVDEEVATGEKRSYV